jgi:hypothetical protein
MQNKVSKVEWMAYNELGDFVVGEDVVLLLQLGLRGRRLHHRFLIFISLLQKNNGF